MDISTTCTYWHGFTASRPVSENDFSSGQWLYLADHSPSLSLPATRRPAVPQGTPRKFLHHHGLLPPFTITNRSQARSSEPSLFLLYSDVTSCQPMSPTRYWVYQRGRHILEHFSPTRRVPTHSEQSFDSFPFEYWILINYRLTGKKTEILTSEKQCVTAFYNFSEMMLISMQFLVGARLVSETKEVVRGRRHTHVRVRPARDLAPWSQTESMANVTTLLPTVLTF